LKAELQTLIPNFRAAPSISLNIVFNGVELRDGRAAHLALFGFGKSESQERAPTLIHWRLTTDNCGRGCNLSNECPANFILLATDYRQLAADDIETIVLSQLQSWVEQNNQGDQWSPWLGFILNPTQDLG
jgi:hypothetical protein